MTRPVAAPSLPIQHDAGQDAAAPPPSPFAAPAMQAPAEKTVTLTLRDIHLPDGVSVWPLAPGWWILMLLPLIVAAVALWWRRRYRRLAFRREALAELESIAARQSSLPAGELADALSTLLKRVALTTRGRHAVAGKSGDTWLQFLDSSGNTKAFSQGPGRALGTARFQPDPPLDAPALLQTCRDWIQKQTC